jgi:two-component system sensor kinase FixL
MSEAPLSPGEASAMELENIKRALDRSAIVAITDTRGVITSVNDKFCEISGYDRSELLGCTHKVVNSGFHPPEFFQSLWKTIAVGSVWEGEIKNRCKNGDDYWVHTTIVPFLDARGKPERYISIRFEITARKDAEVKTLEYARKLEQSNRDLENFASLAAHDLQEPLRKIQAFADRIAARDAERISEQGNVYLGKLLDASGRMRALISDLLTLARVSTHGGESKLINLGNAVSDALQDLELKIEETGARVVAIDLPEIRADPSQVRQLFLNLIGNALKFRHSARAPLIEIRAAHDLPGRVSVAVSDNGIGFDSRHADRIFKPFQRLHTRAEYEGTGIGLAVCQRIVERHGGTIRAEGHPHEGSVFHFTLPSALSPLPDESSHFPLRRKGSSHE